MTEQKLHQSRILNALGTFDYVIVPAKYAGWFLPHWVTLPLAFVCEGHAVPTERKGVRKKTIICGRTEQEPDFYLVSLWDSRIPKDRLIFGVIGFAEWKPGETEMWTSPNWRQKRFLESSFKEAYGEEEDEDDDEED